ncbi:MAG: hypothetical protein NC489_33190 [Ruminococcus flavefaciens]|nr:hypothetical protein [Ruminococcus flavefaciens]
MFSKLKYILFDFSENFKNDFLGLFKKSIAFLVIGIIMFPFMDKVEIIGGIGGVALFMFGFLWGRGLVSSLAGLGSISSNIIIKWTILIFLYIIGIAFGYIYFLWCVIKMIVVLIKNNK